jgi:GLPGLI family protein
MKIIKFIIVLFLITTKSFGQVKEGVVKYQITFNWIKRMKPLNFLSKQEKERMEYQYANLFEWKQFNLLYFNEKESKYIESEEKAQDEGGYAEKKQKYEIHKYFSTNTEKDILEIFGKVHVIEDSLPNLGWKIKNDIREIAGHICMNASREDTTKLQKIDAWFALDIPIPAGPERNFGLPGMILELDVNDGAMLIEAQSVTPTVLTKELEFPVKLKAKKISEAVYFDIINKRMKEKIKAEEYPYSGIPY